MSSCVKHLLDNECHPGAEHHRHGPGAAAVVRATNQLGYDDERELLGELVGRLADLVSPEQLHQALGASAERVRVGIGEGPPLPTWVVDAEGSIWTSTRRGGKVWWNGSGGEQQMILWSELVVHRRARTSTRFPAGPWVGVADVGLLGEARTAATSKVVA